MNRQDIIAISIECGMDVAAKAINNHGWVCYPSELERLVALVIAKDRGRLAAGVDLPEPFIYDAAGKQFGYTADQLRDYGDRRAAAERNACVIACEVHAARVISDGKQQASAIAHECADAIRARGQQ